MSLWNTSPAPAGCSSRCITYEYASCRLPVVSCQQRQLFAFHWQLTTGIWQLLMILATILDTVQRFVDVGGYYVIFGLLFACGLGLPLPEDVPLIIGGYFAATGHMHLPALGIVA